MANVRIISSFTKSEREKIAVIQDIFKICIGTDIPRELQLEKHKPVHKADLRDFKAETWISSMGRGMLRPYCESIVNSVCEYQLERSLRWFGSGYKDDPWTLFLEEVKSWATRTLSWAQCDRETQAMIRSRLRFFEHVLSEPNLFDPFPTHKTTMQQVLFGIRKILRYEIVPLVQSEIAHAGAREDLVSLEVHLRAALDHGIQILYHIFRDTIGAPKNMTVAALREANQEKYQRVLQTSSGLMLRELISSPFFTLVYQDSHFFIEEQSFSIVESFKSGSAVAAADNIYLDNKGNPTIPSILLKGIDDPKRSVALQSLNTVLDDRSGFEPFFRRNKVVAAEFIKAHGLLHELAKLVHVARSAKSLAGQGGSLLVYGVANQQVNQMLQVADLLLHSIRISFERLNQMAEVRFEQLVDFNMARDTDSCWVTHYKKVNFLMEHLNEDLEKSDESVQHIRSQANSVSVEERFQKAKQDVDMFVTQSAKFCHHISNVLQINGSSPAAMSLSALKADLVSALPAQAAADLQRPSLAAPSIPLVLNPTNVHGVVDLHGREISDDNITQKVLVHLEPSVHELSLDKNRIGPDGVMILLEHISKYCPNVNHINLWHNKLGPEGARALGAILLRQDCRIEHLDVNQNDIGDDGAIFIGSALEFAPSLEYLDLAFNGISDVGAQMVLDGMSRASFSKLRFLKLSGNALSFEMARKFIDHVRGQPQFVLLELGTPSDNRNLTNELIAELRALCKPRQEVYFQEKRREAEELKKLLDRPKLKQDAEIPVSVAERKKSIKLRNRRRADSASSASAVVGQMLQLEESPEVIEESNLTDSSTSFAEADFYPLIRVLRVLSSRASGVKKWQKKKLIQQVFRAGIYSASVPNVNMTLDEYMELARATGVIELREERDDRKGKLRTAIALCSPWQNFDVPVPKELSLERLSSQLLDSFIDCCLRKPSMAHRKPAKIVHWLRMNGKDLQGAGDDVLQHLVDTAIYCGLLVRSVSVGKYTVNRSGKDWPVDVAVFPRLAERLKNAL